MCFLPFSLTFRMVGRKDMNVTLTLHSSTVLESNKIHLTLSLPPIYKLGIHGKSIHPYFCYFQSLKYRYRKRNRSSFYKLTNDYSNCRRKYLRDSVSMELGKKLCFAEIFFFWRKKAKQKLECKEMASSETQSSSFQRNKALICCPQKKSWLKNLCEMAVQQINLLVQGKKYTVKTCSILQI